MGIGSLALPGPQKHTAALQSYAGALEAPDLEALLWTQMSEFVVGSGPCLPSFVFFDQNVCLMCHGIEVVIEQVRSRNLRN